MLEVKVWASVYKDAQAASMDIRGKACELDCYTPVRTIQCDRLEDVADIFLDMYGDDLDILCGYSYLYAWVNDGWQRITD